MDQQDHQLLRQLLESTPEQLAAWYNQATDAQLIHANLIMDLYAHYLRDELVLDKIDQQISAMPVLTQAQAVIAAVRNH